MQTERKSLLEAKSHSDAATSAEIVRLQEQNALLMKLLESEKHKSEKAKDLLISRISGLLGDFTSERDKSLRETFGEMRDRNVIGEGEMERCGRENGERIVGVVRAGEDWSGSLARRGGEGKRLRDGAIKVCRLGFSRFTCCLTFVLGIGFVTGDLQERLVRCQCQCCGIRVRVFPGFAEPYAGIGHDVQRW